MITITPQVATLRIVDYEGGPYRAIASICWVTPDTVFMYGLHGTITIRDFKEFVVKMKSMNVNTILRVRRGRVTYLHI